MHGSKKAIGKRFSKLSPSLQKDLRAQSGQDSTLEQMIRDDEVLTRENYLESYELEPDGETEMLFPPAFRRDKYLEDED